MHNHLVCLDHLVPASSPADTLPISPTNRPHMWHDEEHQPNAGDAASSNFADCDICIQAVGCICGSMTDRTAHSIAVGRYNAAAMHTL